MFEARITAKNVVSIGDTKFETETDLSRVRSKNIKLGIRSEFVELTHESGSNRISVNIERVDDFGNFLMVSAKYGENTIKAKVKRDVAIPAGHAWLRFIEKRCCVYSDELII